MLKWLKRNVDGRAVEGPHEISNVEHNSMSGAKKTLDVGPALEYIGVMTAATQVSCGDQLYILNTGGLAYISMGDDTVTLLGTPGEDSFPVFPGEFTVYSAADYTHVIGTAAMHLYRLRDESRARTNKSDR